MNNTASFVKRFRLAQIVVVFLAGIVLFISTACSSSPYRSSDASPILNDKAETTPGGSAEGGESTYKLKDIQAEHMKETYSGESGGGKQGGMNMFSDTDARINNKAVETKASDLVNRAKQNIESHGSNPAQAVKNLKDTASTEKVGDNLNKVSDKVGRKIEETKEGAKRNFRNLQENVKNAPDDISERGQRTDLR